MPRRRAALSFSWLSHTDSGNVVALFSSLFCAQTASKVIASAVRKAGIAGLYGLHGAVNVQGEGETVSHCVRIVSSSLCLSRCLPCVHFTLVMVCVCVCVFPQT